MSFTEKEKQIISWGAANGKSKEEVRSAIINLRAGLTPSQMASAKTTVAGEQVVDTGPGYLERVGGQYEKSAEDIQSAVETGAEKMASGDVLGGVFRSGVGTAAAFVRGVFAPLIELVAPSIQSAISGAVKKEEAGENGGLVGKILTSDTFKNIVTKISDWAQENPDKARNLQDSIDVVTGIVGTPALSKSVSTVTRVGANIARSTGDWGGDAARVISGAIEDVVGAGGKVAAGASTIAKSATEGIARIPERIATNVAEKQAIAAAIEKLPSQAARRAVQEGVDIADARSLLAIAPEQKPLIRKIYDSVKAYVSGESKTNPIEIVGEPIVQRVNFLRREQVSVGRALGEASRNIGNVTTPELREAVLGELKKVPGMTGLAEKNGVLDFKNTVLTTAETLADRRAIQSIYEQAIRWGNGEAKHRLRQELFEILGGKKAAGVQLTATQDRAYQAIRTGLLNVLESKNELYRTLSQQYAKITKPLEEISRRMKGLIGADEDIANMSAGLLARRLTSAATSNPEIRNLLRLLDEATPKVGESLMSAETAQEVYNILNRYFDIAPKTSFQGLSQTAIEKGNVRSAVTQAVTDVIGRSDATRQKALEDLINEILLSS